MIQTAFSSQEKIDKKLLKKFKEIKIYEGLSLTKTYTFS